MRTYNSHTYGVDFFYLPIVRDVDYRIALANGGSRAPSAIDNALIEAIESNSTTSWKDVFNVTDEYWHRNQGADHVSETIHHFYTYLLTSSYVDYRDARARNESTAPD
jgi:hypothetical protein